MAISGPSRFSVRHRKTLFYCVLPHFSNSTAFYHVLLYISASISQYFTASIFSTPLKSYRFSPGQTLQIFPLSGNIPRLVKTVFELRPEFARSQKSRYLLLADSWRSDFQISFFRRKTEKQHCYTSLNLLTLQATIDRRTQRFFFSTRLKIRQCFTFCVRTKTYLQVGRDNLPPTVSGTKLTPSL